MMRGLECPLDLTLERGQWDLKEMPVIVVGALVLLGPGCVCMRVCGLRGSPPDAEGAAEIRSLGL